MPAVSINSIGQPSMASRTRDDIARGARRRRDDAAGKAGERVHEAALADVGRAGDDDFPRFDQMPAHRNQFLQPPRIRRTPFPCPVRLIEQDPKRCVAVGALASSRESRRGHPRQELLPGDDFGAALARRVAGSCAPLRRRRGNATPRASALAARRFHRDPNRAEPAEPESARVSGCFGETRRWPGLNSARDDRPGERAAHAPARRWRLLPRQGRGGMLVQLRLHPASDAVRQTAPRECRMPSSVISGQRWSVMPQSGR